MRFGYDLSTTCCLFFREFLDKFEQDMEAFDQNLRKCFSTCKKFIRLFFFCFQAYLSYLQNFVTMIQSDSSLLISTYQKSLLEEEWTFIKQTW